MAVKRGLQAVVFDFVQSQKNHPALDFLTTIADTGEIIGTKQIFRIQAERAQAAKPMFDDAPAYIGKDGRLPASAPQQANSSVDVRSLSALYLHIATKLETAQAIVEATRVVETLQLDKDVACTPSTDVEQAVARIWGKLLGISVLDNNIDFFDLGGNSLMAIRALSRIQEEYEVTLPLTLFFDDKTTVASIASSIEQALGARIGP
jgi:acyl carrier protein